MLAHIHDIIRELNEHPGELEAKKFASSLKEKFGPETEYENCCGIAIPAEGILKFLEDRAKIEVVEGKVYSKVLELHANQ